MCASQTHWTVSLSQDPRLIQTKTQLPLLDCESRSLRTVLAAPCELLSAETLQARQAAQQLTCEGRAVAVNNVYVPAARRAKEAAAQCAVRPATAAWRLRRVPASPTAARLLNNKAGMVSQSRRFAWPGKCAAGGAGSGT